MMPREDQSLLKPLKSALKGKRCDDDTMDVQHRRRHRRVHFSKKRHARTFEIRLPMNLWYHFTETDKFRDDLASEIKAWRKGNPYAKLLDNVFGSQNEIMVQRRLNAFTRLPEDDYHRGGEKYCCKHNAKERKKNKVAYVEETVAEYKRCLLADMIDEDIATHVAEFAQKMSHAARSFAERLGRADAAAVFLGEKRELADILVVEMSNGLTGGVCVGKQDTGAMTRRFSAAWTRTPVRGVAREPRRRSHSLNLMAPSLPNPLSTTPSSATPSSVTPSSVTPSSATPSSVTPSLTTVTTEKPHVGGESSKQPHGYVSKRPDAMNPLVNLAQSQVSVGFIPEYPLPLRSMPLRNPPVVAEHMRWQPKKKGCNRSFARMA